MEKMEKPEMPRYGQIHTFESLEYKQKQAALPIENAIFEKIILALRNYTFPDYESSEIIKADVVSLIKKLQDENDWCMKNNTTIHAPNEVHLVLSKEEIEMIKQALSYFGFNATIEPDMRFHIESIITKL